MPEKTKEQVIAQSRVVAHLAKQLMIAHEETAQVYESGEMSAVLIDIVGNRTAAAMEALGDILNGMDAVDEVEGWVDPVFEAAQELWPQPGAHTISQGRPIDSFFSVSRRNPYGKL